MLDMDAGSDRTRAALRLNRATGSATQVHSPLDRLAALAARLLDAPAAQLSLLSDVQFIAGSAGQPEGTTGSRSAVADSLCTVTASRLVPLVVGSAATDPRVAHLPPVTSGQVGSYLGAPLTDGHGHTVGALCVFGPQSRDWSATDVTILEELAAAAMAELELSALSGEYQTNRLVLDLAIDAAQIGIFDLDLVTGTRSWDDRMLELFGYTRDDFASTMDALADGVHPEDRPRVLAAVRDAIDHGGTFETEYRVLAPDGSTRWVATRGRALRDASGATVRVLGAAQDTTALRESNARIAEVLESMAVGYLAMDSLWRITYVNTEGGRILGAAGDDLVGHELWHVFPATVGTDDETHYRRAVATGQVVTFDAYYPEPRNAWFEIRATPEPAGLALYFLDITARRAAQDRAEAAIRQQAADAEAMAGLVAVAQALGEADTETEILEVISQRAVALLGAPGAVLCLREDDGEHVRALTTGFLDDEMEAEMASLPVHFPLPVVHTATTGTAHYLPDRCAAAAIFPLAGELYAHAHTEASAAVPLHAGRVLLGSLSVGYPEPRTWRQADRDLLVALAALTAQALDRLRARDAERASGLIVAKMAEGLQRSLLTELPEPSHLQITARYVPAAAHAQVGGDWYDSFVVGQGATYLVIGDVCGHDRDAAVSMAAVRNVLRGVAHATAQTPATVLSALDRAMSDLAVNAMATAVLARLEQSPRQAAEGLRTLVWSNAGHPPPLLVSSDGDARFLTADADLLLGVDTGTDRHDHAQVLEPGSTVLLYTDGLIERRGEDLGAGLERLRRVTRALTSPDSGEGTGLDLDTLCDALLSQLSADADDDVALLAVRAHPEDATSLTTPCRKAGWRRGPST